MFSATITIISIQTLTRFLKFRSFVLLWWGFGCSSLCFDVRLTAQPTKTHARSLVLVAIQL